ncbi:MAG: FAD/NAD(P)-binding protein [Candidatus Zixiibacteriota bacterium]|nr:MAG: FAD/NAD(P)-binding protein [candidate division Zixibacteria bacterium]
MLVFPFTVARVIRESHDTFSLELESRNRRREFSFVPGQFNMLYVYGIGEVPISISGDPNRSKVLVHTTREVGTVTRAIRKLKVGDTIGVRGPYGRGWPIEKAHGHDVVLVTGGIGLAPLRPVIYCLLSNREKYGKIVLLYGARTPEDILYRKDLERWRSRFDLETYLTVDRATGAWHGNVGVVTSLIGRSSFDPFHCVAMACGPEIMMRFTMLELQKRGVEDARMFVSMERSMKCGIGLCGHCQIGSTFVCKDGPVYSYNSVRNIFMKREM